MNDLTVRPITGRDELDLFRRLPYTLDGEIPGDLDAGRRSPESMWVALRGDRLLARVAWWRRAADGAPEVLDILDLDDGATDLASADRVDIGAHLLETALAAVVPDGARRPEYIRFVPPGWRDEKPTRLAVEERMTALERTGAELFVERLRLEWRPGAPVPPPGGRLRFRPPRDTGELPALMTAVLDGTLDAHSRHSLTRMPPRAVAAEHYEDELSRYPSPRDWWRVATLPDGEPVGFVIPARNPYHAIIAYIGVLPAHRGNGYIDEILAEGTRVLAARDVPRIRAATDLANVPMAKAFERAGYVAHEHAIHMTWS